MSLTLNASDIARIGASIPARTRITDPAARELAKATISQAKAQALESARVSAMRYLDYTESQHKRINALRDVHWPRVRAVRDSIGHARALLARHDDKHDDYSLVTVPACGQREDMAVCAACGHECACVANDRSGDTRCPRHSYAAETGAFTYEATLYRLYRLEHLLARAYAASAAIGRFPVSLADMRTDRGTDLIKSAWKRHFTFAGGRDWGSAEFSPADIVQGAFLRALENGDAVDGVPAYGSMFRHIQAERARLTNLANAEYSARKRSALGWTSAASERDRLAEFPETTHTLRLLDTRNYATTADHRKALAIAHRDAELATMDDYVTRDARESEVSIANAEEFHVVLAEYLLKGHTLADIASALGLTVDTVASRAIKSREDSLRRMSTGIDHSERSVDLHNAAEREREIDEAQARHAEILRERYVSAQTAHYAMSRA